jgi:hypothetical protein
VQGPCSLFACGTATIPTSSAVMLQPRFSALFLFNVLLSYRTQATLLTTCTQTTPFFTSLTSRASWTDASLDLSHFRASLPFAPPSMLHHHSEFLQRVCWCVSQIPSACFKISTLALVPRRTRTCSAKHRLQITSWCGVAWFHAGPVPYLQPRPSRQNHLALLVI